MDRLSDPHIQALEDHIKEEAHTRNLDLQDVYRYASYRWFYYVLLRLARPSIVVETGVWYGTSTAFILQALEDNGKGELYSIDLPNAQYRRDDGAEVVDSVGKPENTGLLVPPNLWHRWHLILGRARNRLKPLLRSLRGIDVFIHDGEHTYEAMMFEFKIAFKFLKRGGTLITDDVHLNDAFLDFIGQVRCKSVIFQRSQNEYMGALIKS